MALHQIIQRVLLVGVRFEKRPIHAAPEPPRQLVPLIETLATAHRESDERAIRFGHRYRSGFWAIYLLSAIAVICAVVPLALGWDSPGHALHPFAGVWAIAEVAVIGTVSVIYWRGHRSDWQGQWLRSRTTAELTSYLPLIAPLVDFSDSHSEPNWYLRLMDPAQHLPASGEVAGLCRLNEPLARQLLAGAWSERGFVLGYVRWAVAILEAQERYHAHTAHSAHALLHRVHRLTTWLFALTAAGAIAHLLVHSRWLTLLTTFFPALAASLHGALAQAEAYRLHATSERLVVELRAAVDEIRRAGEAEPSATTLEDIKATVLGAVALILEEHQDWHMLVRPHHLPLA
jgi:hypothetical protein